MICRGVHQKDEKSLCTGRAAAAQTWGPAALGDIKFIDFDEFEQFTKEFRVCSWKYFYNE